MRRKSTKIATPTLGAMTVIFRQRGFKRPKGCAGIYMKGFNDAKEKYQKKKTIDGSYKKINER
jgi:hypothetical protein